MSEGEYAARMLSQRVQALNEITEREGGGIYATAGVLNALQAVADTLAWQMDRAKLGQVVTPFDARIAMAAHGATPEALVWAPRVAAMVRQAPGSPPVNRPAEGTGRARVLAAAVDLIGDPDEVHSEYVRALGDVAAALTGSDDPEAVRDSILAEAAQRWDSDKCLPCEYGAPGACTCGGEVVRGCSCGMADYGAPGHDGHDETEGGA